MHSRAYYVSRLLLHRRDKHYKADSLLPLLYYFVKNGCLSYYWATTFFSWRDRTVVVRFINARSRSSYHKTYHFQKLGGWSKLYFYYVCPSGRSLKWNPLLGCIIQREVKFNTIVNMQNLAFIILACEFKTMQKELLRFNQEVYISLHGKIGFVFSLHLHLPMVSPTSFANLNF